MIHQCYDSPMFSTWQTVMIHHGPIFTSFHQQFVMWKTLHIFKISLMSRPIPISWMMNTAIHQWIQDDIGPCLQVATRGSPMPSRCQPVSCPGPRRSSRSDKSINWSDHELDIYVYICILYIYMYIIYIYVLYMYIYIYN